MPLGVRRALPGGTSAHLDICLVLQQAAYEALAKSLAGTGYSGRWGPLSSAHCPPTGQDRLTSKLGWASWSPVAGLPHLLAVVRGRLLGEVTPVLCNNKPPSPTPSLHTQHMGKLRHMLCSCKRLRKSPTASQVVKLAKVGGCRCCLALRLSTEASPPGSFPCRGRRPWPGPRVGNWLAPGQGLLHFLLQVAVTMSCCHQHVLPDQEPNFALPLCSRWPCRVWCEAGFPVPR